MPLDYRLIFVPLKFDGPSSEAGFESVNASFKDYQIRVSRFRSAEKKNLVILLAGVLPGLL